MSFVTVALCVLVVDVLSPLALAAALCAFVSPLWFVPRLVIAHADERAAAQNQIDFAVDARLPRAAPEHLVVRDHEPLVQTIEALDREIQLYKESYPMASQSRVDELTHEARALGKLWVPIVLLVVLFAGAAVAPASLTWDGATVPFAIFAASLAALLAKARSSLAHRFVLAAKPRPLRERAQPTAPGGSEALSESARADDTHYRLFMPCESLGPRRVLPLDESHLPVDGELSSPNLRRRRQDR